MKDRSIKLLNKLLVSKFPISIKRLELEFNISSRTIRNEIILVNEFLKQHSFSEIESIRMQGFRLELSDQEKIRLKEILNTKESIDFLNREERHLDLLLSIGFSEKPVFLNKKEVEYDVSKSTIDEDMRQLRKFLQSYHIDIVSHPKEGLVFDGKESSIRVMLFKVVGQELVRPYRNLEGIKAKLISDYIPTQFLQQLEEIFDQTISDREDSFYRMYFNLFTGIWLLRLSNGHFIREQNKEEVETHSSLAPYLNRVYRDFPIIFSKWEKNYIAFMLKTLYTNEKDNPSNWLELQMVVLQLIHFVEERTGIPFSQKETQLQKGLYNHMVGMVARVEKGIQLSNPLKERIQHSYGQIYDAVEQFSRRFSKLLGNDIIEDEVAFLTIHFSTALSELNQAQQSSFRAVVICNQGIVTGRLVSERLKESFNIEVLAVLNSREIDIVQKLDVDLVFSTIDIDYHDKPTLVVDPIIQEDGKKRIAQFLQLHKDKQTVVRKNPDYTQLFLDILKIFERNQAIDKTVYESVEELFYVNQLRINKREVQPMIEDILTDDHILMMDNPIDWRDAIRQTASPLYQKKIIEDRYIEAMIQSVETYGPYIVMAPGLALAHARPEDGAKALGLSVAIFKYPVVFDEEHQDVQVVFCLSAVDAFSHLNVMKSLVNLIRETDKIEQLSRARDIISVKKILFQLKEEK